MPSSDNQIIATLAAKAAVSEFVNGPAFETTVERTVEAVLLKLGLDTDHPDAMRLDMAHLRRGRQRSELVQNKGMGAAVTAVVGLVFTIIGAGITALIYR